MTTEAVKKRHLEAIVSASGKIQAKRDVNISADTMGRVTELAVDEGYRVKKGQFLMQIDPRNLKSAVQRTEASLAAARSNAEQVRLALDSARVALKQAQDNYKRQQDLWKGGLTTRETLEKAENDLEARQADLASQEQNVRTMQLRMESESATAESARYDLSKVRIESPIDGIVTRRNIEEGETVVIGTMNNAGTVLLTIADMSVIQAEVEVDETDIPIAADRSAGQGHDRRDARADVHRQGHRDWQQSDPGARPARRRHRRRTSRWSSRSTRRSRKCGPASRARRRSRPRSRDSAVAVPIQATTVREMVVDEKGNIVRPPDDAKGKRRSRRRRRQADRARAGADAQGTRRGVRGPGQQGGVHADQDRHRRRKILRGAVGPQRRRRGHHGPVLVGALARGGGSGQARNDAAPATKP